MRKIKEVLRLRFELSLSYENIARSANIGDTTVREYICRANKAKLTWPLPDGMEDEGLNKLLYPPKEIQPSDQIVP